MDQSVSLCEWKVQEFKWRGCEYELSGVHLDELNEG